MSASRTTKASVPGLTKVKTATERKGWRKTSPALLDAACVSGATLKRFWRGIAIDTGSFEAICAAVNLPADEVAEPEAEAMQSLERSHSGERSVAEAAGYDDVWVGHTALIETLHTQLLGNYRLLSLTGFTGIGKTALARYLASSLASEGYTCIHLSCDQQNPPTLASIAHVLSKQTTSNGSAMKVELSLQGLVTHLLEHKYLLIIDALEGLMTHNVQRGWSEFCSSIWPKFFQVILGADTCQSKFIVTSQDISHELEVLGDRWPHRWCAQSLVGLAKPEQIELFLQLGLSPAAHSSDYQQLVQIGAAYAGHPLALRAIARDITNRFGSNIAAYWNEHHTFICPDKTAINPKLNTRPNLHSHSRPLRQQVQPKIAQMLERLAHQHPSAYQLLQAGATTDNRPKPSHNWLQLAQSVKQEKEPKEQQNGTELATSASTYTESGQVRLWLDVLCDRAFITPSIQDNRLHYTLHPLIHSFLQSA